MLYAFQYDYGSASGISYAARFQTLATIPEPSTAFLLALFFGVTVLRGLIYSPR